MPARLLHPLEAVLVLPEVTEADLLCALLFPVPARLVNPVPPRAPALWTELEVLALQGMASKGAPRMVWAGRPVVGLPKQRPLPAPVDSVALSQVEEGPPTLVETGVCA